jgi:hypothetical protein
VEDTVRSWRLFIAIENEMLMTINYGRETSTISGNDHNGQLGTVCDRYYNNYWDMNDARVACRQLGFTKAVAYMHAGQGNGKIWLDNMGCTGSETSLESCTHNGWGVVNSVCNTHTYDDCDVL